MISRGGTFLVHREKDVVLNQTFFISSMAMSDNRFKEVGHRMVRGESGVATFKKDGHEFYFVYAPIKTTNWSVAVSCLKSEAFAGVDSMRNSMFWIALTVLCIMAVLCYVIIFRLLAPLMQFAKLANGIAHGNFSAKLPRVKSKGEMRVLRDSFDYMQRSLVKYTEELKTTIANSERIESELRIARAIQMGMVPKIFPPYPDREDVDLYAMLVPAKEVGGDLYDFFIENEKLFFIIGDVSGKGIPASLVMAVTCRLFRTVASHFHTPAEIVTALNDTLSENNESNMFCTFFLGILDLQTGEMKYCNAGHNAPVVMHASGKVEYMDVLPNLPLGLFGGFPYEDQKCMLSKGDSLFLYTDGVTEAENVEKELYSDEHLLEFLASYQGEDPKKVVEGVMEDIHRHAIGAEQSDDITVMCLNYK
jgi:sigma-B regulation protein RsbU (phosphoserine phosphatase)